MKNNKGFTLVELLVSFTLSMILVIIMFQLIINLKEVYEISGIKTEMINKQYLMINKIYTDLTTNKLVAIAKCDGIEECIDLTYNNNTKKRLLIDLNNSQISYDNYIIKLKNDFYFTTVTIKTTGFTNELNKNRILSINIPIYSTKIKNYNFGINIVYPYNNLEIIDTFN